MAPKSMQVTIDLTNYKDKVGSRVEPGRYKVVVQDAEPDTSSNGNPMINLWFDILEGPAKGQTIVDRLVLTERSMFRVVGFMQAIGLPALKKKLNVNVGSWVGKTLEIDVEDGDPYNNRIKSEVRGYNRIVRPVAAAPEAGEGDDTSDDLVDAQAAADDGLEEFAPPPEKGSPEEKAAMASSTEDVPDVVNLDDLDL